MFLIQVLLRINAIRKRNLHLIGIKGCLEFFISLFYLPFFVLDLFMLNLSLQVLKTVYLKVDFKESRFCGFKTLVTNPYSLTLV